MKKDVDGMKRIKGWLVCGLALFLLASTALAAEEEKFPYLTSDWAHEEVSRALELGLVYDPCGYFCDTSHPISRGDFSANAAALVAKGFGTDLYGYVVITRYRWEAESEDPFNRPSFDLEAAHNLGILLDGEAGDESLYGPYDADSHITRQEAAVILGRTYRAYQSAVPDLEPVSYTDWDEVADWALDDVALMNQLGAMTGVGEGRFAPLEDCTVEQCILSLLRLYEKVPFDAARRENPLVIPKLEGGFLHKDYQTGLCFALETENYYICAAISPTGGAGRGGAVYDIYVIDQDLFVRTYSPPIISWSSSARGTEYARPGNPSLSEDGAKLIYTATVEEDVYPIEKGVEEANRPLMFEQGVYTVTMDLTTGEQTWTRADLP